MRWPWQRKRETAPIVEEIEEQQAKHEKVLQRARQAERMIVGDYEQAEERRVAGRAKP